MLRGKTPDVREAGLVGNLLCRDAANRAVSLRERGVDNGVGPNGGIAADADGSEQLGPRAYVNVVAQGGRSRPLLAGGAADIGAYVDAAVFSYPGRAADYDGADVDDGQAFVKHIDGDGPVVFGAEQVVAKAQELANNSTKGIMAAVGVVFRLSETFVELEAAVPKAADKT